jgi:phenylpyruvate tautomerase PptA (4-oxalocrotonate tautomerase family)
MIEVANLRLNEVLGPLPEATYAAIHAVDADSWGYGGVTQSARQGIGVLP